MTIVNRTASPMALECITATAMSLEDIAAAMNPGEKEKYTRDLTDQSARLLETTLSSFDASSTMVDVNEA